MMEFLGTRMWRSVANVVKSAGLLYKELALSALTLVPALRRERRVLVRAASVAIDA